MTSSPAFSGSEDDSPACSTRTLDIPEPVKEGLRLSIIAKRRALGEKQLKITFTDPQEFELTPAEMEKKERRREQNRRAAQRCRNKKRLNHKYVVQNYEKVIAKNSELQYELDTVRRELKLLRSSLACHSTCCPSLASVKCEPIKTEALTDEEFQDSVEDSFPITAESSSLRRQTEMAAMSCDLPGLAPEHMTRYEHARESHKAPTQSPGSFPYQHKLGGVVQADRIFVLPVEPQPSVTDIGQLDSWLYSHSVAPVGQSPTLFPLCKSAPLKSPQTPNQGQQNSTQHEEQCQHLLPEQTEYKQSYLEYIYAPRYAHHIPAQVSSTPLIPQATTQSQLYLDRCRQLQSHNSPCQVVPSLRSPRPNCVTPRTSSSRDAPTRHRSLSGGSFSSTSETIGSCFEEKPLSSVSSDGSVHADNQLGIFQDLRTLEVPDMDTDDVFISAPDVGVALLASSDVNNNNEVTPDNNRVIETELLQFLVDSGLVSSPELVDPVRVDLARGGEAEDVTALMQISTEDLQLFMDSNDQTIDLTSSLMPDTQRINF